ncbi:zinc finger CCCH domain-containing protein 7A [Trichomycterus rosablanca]|uniref:zinc finger CCCH domain-containing protein 7A n=1 Tax=Trichomycterus rosablanca TaxID=2290929 RepID=UPI002F360A07
MSGMGQNRSSRYQDIEKGLQFIQSTLPYPGTQEQYEVFIQDLVRNLLAEGNDVFHEGEWAKSVELYTEALNVAEYAESEEINISTQIREKLHANRAASYLNIGLHDQALEDCENALQINKNNYRALYRKARCLKEMGKCQEAYEVIAKCSMVVPQDASVIELTQELAKMLGLKIRKAYVRGKPALNVESGPSVAGAASDKPLSNTSSVEDIETDESQYLQSTSNPTPVSTSQYPPASTKAEVKPQPVPLSAMPSKTPESRNPEPIPLVMPLINGSRASEPYTAPDPQLDFDGEILGDDLDELLDEAAPSDTALVIPTMTGPLPLPSSIATSSSMTAPLHGHPFLGPAMHMAPQCTVTLPAPYHKPNPSGYSFAMDSFPSHLDSLDSLSISESLPEKPLRTGFGQHPFMMGNSERPLPTVPPMEIPFGIPDSGIYSLEVPQYMDLGRNPLADMYEFKAACSVCFLKTGPGIQDYTYHEEEHKCKKDLLLGRIKHFDNTTWKLIRPRPKNQYLGSYYICKDVSSGEECKYLGHCTFAYCQEEIDVWTHERKGFISRDLLCDPYGSRTKLNMTVSKILQEHQGIFMFLCEVCFDHKPRMLSKPGVCSHPVKSHEADENKCLVHFLKDNTMKFSKIRLYHTLCQLDLCRHAARYGCQREDFCFYAHSLIELKVWMMQREQGIAHESIVQEAKKYWSTKNSSQAQELPAVLKKFGPPNLKMQFVCGQCWRNGQVSEPDKNKKYCSAKARHAWLKDRQVVLISSIERRKWIAARPLPTRKPAPAQFELCLHVAAGKKCQYIGNCTFAHSSEEKDLWTFMKDNNIADFEHLYDLWLQSQKPGSSEDGLSGAAKENGKPIHMPTDYAEEVTGNHCWLCGKNCNSEKQWQQHITSEKHKDRMFNSEDEQNCWQYRFPTGNFNVCERFLKGTCTEGEQCKLAHGEEELAEWMERKEFLLRKLDKARNDHLIAPNDDDFGKYNFLLKELK